MAELLARLTQDMNNARKAQDKPRTLLLGTILSDIKNRKIELRRDPTDEEVLDVVRRGIKRRRESVEMYTTAKRDDLAEKERAEIALLEEYQPPQVGDDEIRTAVRAAVEGGAANLGAVLAAVLPRFKGRAEGSTISAIAREELGKKG